MVKAKRGILACAVLLDPKGSDSSWANHFHYVAAPGARMMMLMPELQDRHPSPSPSRWPTPRQGRATIHSHIAGDAELPAQSFSYRGSRGRAMGGGGRIRRVRLWRSGKAFVPPSAQQARSSALAARAGRFACRGERRPWQRGWLPGFVYRCGHLARTPPRQRGFMRLCGGVVPMTIIGRDGDAVGLSPRQPFGAGPFMTASQRDEFARPEVPRWAHKAVIIPG